MQAASGLSGSLSLVATGRSATGSLMRTFGASQGYLMEAQQAANAAEIGRSKRQDRWRRDRRGEAPRCRDRAAGDA